MSASRNADAVSNQTGEFSSRIERDEPQTTHGHKPGVLVGNDAVPTFSAQTLPPGTAPSDRTFAPNPTSETPGQANNDASLASDDKESTYTSATDTLGGATSGDVHTGFGHPGQGQTSQELHQGGGAGGGREGGLAGVGSGEAASGNQMADERVQAGQRGLEKEEGQFAGTRGDKGAEAAEDRLNESA